MLLDVLRRPGGGEAAQCGGRAGGLFAISGAAEAITLARIRTRWSERWRRGRRWPA